MAQATCEICGEPMQEGEEMFNFHGSLGPCPKPPLPKPKLEAMVEYLYRETDGQFWLDVHVDRQPYASLGPFTERERYVALADLLNMVRSLGGKDLPKRAQ